MLDTEIFSEEAWSTPSAVYFNKKTKRGIKNQYKQSVVDCAEPFPVICKHPMTYERTPYGPHRGYREYVCTTCNKVVHTEDSTD